MTLALIFLFSLLIDVGAVVFTRSVQGRRMLIGALTTGSLAALNWASIWIVVKQDDETLMLASILGHVTGFVIGMVVPIERAVAHACETGHPTTGPGSQSSDPS